ncbi:MAG: CopG family transcriptional regulator [Rhizobiaceae bacterium]|nr:CopG family transcriptional regulator [Rhizobiaceae bacterium]
MAGKVTYSEFVTVTLDESVAQALNQLAEGMNMSREEAAAYVIREYLIAIGALDSWDVEEDMVTVGNA